MTLKINPVHSRNESYGQRRQFRGIEKFAIQRRMSAAYSLLDTLVAENHGKNLAVLELGCGFFGSNLRALKSTYPLVKFTGVDVAVDDDATDQIELIPGDLRTWTPKTDYDAVLSLAVVEHLLEPLAHFELISKCLKKGGLARVTTPTPGAHNLLLTLGRFGIFDRAEIEDHQLYLTETGIRRMATQAEMRTLEFKTFSFGFNQWMLLKKIG